MDNARNASGGCFRHRCSAASQQLSRNVTARKRAAATLRNQVHLTSVASRARVPSSGRRRGVGVPSGRGCAQARRRHYAQPYVFEILGHMGASSKVGPTLHPVRANVDIGKAQRRGGAIGARMRPSTRLTLRATIYSAQPLVSEVLGYIKASPKLGPTLRLTRATAIIGAAARCGRVVWARMRPSAPPTLCATICARSAWVHKRAPETKTNVAPYASKCHHRRDSAGRPRRLTAHAPKRAADTLRNHLYPKFLGT